MFASIVCVMSTAWSKVAAFSAQVAAFIKTGAQHTIKIVAPVLNVASMMAFAVLTSVAVAQAAQEAEQQAVKAPVLADRLLLGNVELEDVDATVAAYGVYQAHAAAHSFFWDLPTTEELRRAARARCVVRLLLV